MANFEVKRSLCTYFTTLMKGEHEIEQQRVYLAQSPSFSPQDLFNYVNTSGLGISANEILHFMKAQNQTVGVGYHEAYMLVQQYDKKKQQRIDFMDFENLILPTTKPFFRNQLQSSGQRLFPETLKNFAHLVLLELELARKLNGQKLILTRRQDFNLLAAYKTISAKVPDGIDRQAIGDFLNQNGESVKTEDMEAIIRRLDRDKDRVINYTEFVHEFMPCQSFEESHGGDARTLLDRLSPDRSSPLRGSSLAKRSTSPFLQRHMNKTDVAPSTYVGIPQKFRDLSSHSQDSSLKFNYTSSESIQPASKSIILSPVKESYQTPMKEDTTRSPLKISASSPLRLNDLETPASKFSATKERSSPLRGRFPARLMESYSPSQSKPEETPMRSPPKQRSAISPISRIQLSTRDFSENKALMSVTPTANTIQARIPSPIRVRTASAIPSSNIRSDLFQSRLRPESPQILSRVPPKPSALKGIYSSLPSSPLREESRGQVINTRNSELAYSSPIKEIRSKYLDAPRNTTPLSFMSSYQSVHKRISSVGSVRFNDMQSFDNNISWITVSPSPHLRSFASIPAETQKESPVKFKPIRMSTDVVRLDAGNACRRLQYSPSKSEAYLKSPIRETSTQPQVASLKSSIPETSTLPPVDPLIVKIAQNDKLIEALRQQLILRYDFNLSDLFNIFDVDRNGALSAQNFTDALMCFDIIPDLDAVTILCAHYSEGLRLVFDQFSKIFLPNEIQYGTILKLRHPTGRTRFSTETEDKIKHLMSNLLDNEILVKQFKQNTGEKLSSQAFTEMEADIPNLDKILARNGITVNL